MNTERMVMPFLRKGQRDKANLKSKRRNREFLDFGFGSIKFKTPISHPSSYVKRQLNI